MIKENKKSSIPEKSILLRDLEAKRMYLQYLPVCIAQNSVPSNSIDLSCVMKEMDKLRQEYEMLKTSLKAEELRNYNQNLAHNKNTQISVNDIIECIGMINKKNARSILEKIGIINKDGSLSENYIESEDKISYRYHTATQK
ncbi:hypothetical protein CLV62_12513 [Dysgonomonas alginatilytica]|uniref:Uncharacterized protein n=1 Tax=Dysgonomonas alginatilytica TaxID=1605892 RepID=A0A2V3PMQ8_9BACT|nr:hypothetical protein [Dysgonomonas alginatilytica]PXV61180.1 hypothetical protein CLV62_12513 [Dysgonomonas alginatilytica]